MGLRNVVFGLAVGFALVAPASARAQMWLAPAVPDRPMLGPLNSTGVVIWNHGISVDSEDSSAATPPYMAALRDGGWDALRFNRMRASDKLAESTRGLIEQVHKLKQQGYPRIALAGQSFGAFLALMAADASDEVDAVVVTAPAAYGSFSEFFDSWRNNAAKLYPLLERVRRARVMAFYFHGDDFDPGGRGEHTATILMARKLPHLVVDQPPNLTTHWAAASPQFATLYGACILGFLTAPEMGEDAACGENGFSPGHPSSPSREIAPQVAVSG
ncbi:MAG: hypothetical protein ACLQJR_25465 [Stellaceae bacterium]